MLSRSTFNACPEAMKTRIVQKNTKPTLAPTSVTTQRSIRLWHAIRRSIGIKP